MSRRKRLACAAALVLVALYVVGPAIAAFLEVGDRWGPKIYPLWYHQAVYLIAWEWGTHPERKPRVGFWYKEQNRPWVHGMHNRNDDRVHDEPNRETLRKEGK